MAHQPPGRRRYRAEPNGLGATDATARFEMAPRDDDEGGLISCEETPALIDHPRLE